MDPGFANQATPSCSDAGGREPRTRAPARGRTTILALFALLLLAGCGSTPQLQLDPRPSAGHYSGSSLRVLHEAMPMSTGTRPSTCSTANCATSRRCASLI